MLGGYRDGGTTVLPTSNNASYRPTPEGDLANRVNSLLHNLLSAPKTWLVYLVDHRFDEEPELRNKIFVLFTYALIETNENIGSRLHDLTVDAHRMKSLSSLHYLDKIRFMLEAAADLGGIFSRDEMIAIGELRQQWLHGRVDAHFRENRVVRFLENGVVTRKKVHHAEYWQVFERVTGGRGLDFALEPLRLRFTNAKSLYWLVYVLLDQHLEKISAQMHEHSSFVKPVIDIRYSPNGYAETKAQAEAVGGCLSLRDVRRLLTPGLRRRDPIFS